MMRECPPNNNMDSSWCQVEELPKKSTENVQNTDMATSYHRYWYYDSY